MDILNEKAKATATIAIFLLLASVALMAMPAQAQYGYWTPPPEPTNVQDSGSLTSIPAGVTPGFTLKVDPYLSFRPNPVGVGQTILVNIWTVPGPAVTRYFSDLKVTITRPDGTTDVLVMDSYQADSTAWFEYVVDQVGEWTLKYDFPGAYFPAGNYTMASDTGRAGFTESYEKSIWYLPASTAEQTLIVQEDMVSSWPPAALPTDYWNRPGSLMNREWWPILGNYPWYGPGGGAMWDELYPDTNPQWSPDYYFTPWVQAPNSAHIVWKRQGAIAGLIGGTAGIYGLTSSPGTPDVIYSGRCYDTLTVPVNGVPTSCAVCYDLRTGEIYYTIPTAEGGVTPSYIQYVDPSQSNPEVPGAEARLSWSVELISISGNRLIKINPWTGAATTNVSIAVSPSMSNTYYMNGYVLGVQTLSTTGNENLDEHEGGTGSAGSATAGVYRLINWTTLGSTTSMNARIISNISWPRSSLGVTQDFTTGLAFECRENNFFDLANMGYPYVDTYYDNASGVRYGNRIKAYNLVTGQEIWDVSVGESQYSSSCVVADHGKIAVVMQDAGPNTSGGGYVMCWDQYTGKLLWKSEQMDYPWSRPGFGAYAIQSAYGMLFRQGYDGIYAFDWDTGKIVWKYKAPTNPYETPYVDENGGTVMSWNSGGRIADGKMYVYNSEHTTTWPITRGWQLHCINITTGELIWKIANPMTITAVADGYLPAANSWDGYMYVFGKGKSETTISAPLTAITQGQSLMLTGTVLDQSPAQPGTPCVSKDSMSLQMEYLHLQQPISGLYNNETITGVPVSLDTVDPNGNFRHIADVVTDGYSGTFGYTWTPDVPGQYAVTATFMGDDSYGSSFAQTYISVSEAPPATATPEPPQEEPDNMPIYLLGATIAIIIAIAIVGILLLRKR